MPFQQRGIKNLALMKKLHLARGEAGYQGNKQPLSSEERILLKVLYDRAKEVDKIQTADSPFVKESAAARVKDRCGAGIWYCNPTSGRRAFIPRPLPWQRQHKTFQPRNPEVGN